MPTSVSQSEITCPRPRFVEHIFTSKRQVCLPQIRGPESQSFRGRVYHENVSLAQPATPPTAKDRVLNVAYELFSTRGIRDVGIDEVIEKAGIAKATLYRHFPSKDDLVRAFLRQREQEWTHGVVEAGALQRGSTPHDQLLAIFDILDEWFHTKEFEGCSFINILLEMGSDHPLGQASIVHLKNIREIVFGLATEAGIADPDGFAHSWHILMKGSIVAAGEGDLDAAKRAKDMARCLIEAHGLGA